MHSFKQTSIVLTALSFMLLPAGAAAYVSPYEVLLAPELALPPTSRETSDRIRIQQEESAMRRAQEQQEAYDAQHPDEVAEEETHGAAPEEESEAEPASNAAIDPELQSLLRALERIQEGRERASLREEALSILEQQGLVLVPEESLHGSAIDLGKGKGLDPRGKGPLPPSGAGTVMAAITGLAAIGWTLRRAAIQRAIAR
jgi:hypothetical protein